MDPGMRSRQASFSTTTTAQDGRFSEDTLTPEGQAVDNGLRPPSPFTRENRRPSQTSGELSEATVYHTATQDSSDMDVGWGGNGSSAAEAWVRFP